MTNNPMLALQSALRRFQDPAAVLQQLSANDPRAAQAQRILSGKPPQQVRQICETMCRERGVTPRQIAQDLGIPGF